MRVEDGVAELWEAHQMTRLRTFSRERDARSVDFHPDGGRVLVGWEDNMVSLWDISAYDGADGPLEDACDSGFMLTGSFSLAGDTRGLAANHALPASPPCGTVPGTGEGPDAVYRLQTAVAGEMTISLLPEVADLALYLAEDCGALISTCVALASSAGPGEVETLSFPPEPGTVYYILVNGVSGDAGAFELMGDFNVNESQILEGLVVDARTQTAVSGVLVNAARAGTASMLAASTTQEGGEYALEVPLGVTVLDLEYSREGYETQRVQGVAAPGILDIELVPLIPELSVFPVGKSVRAGAGTTVLHVRNAGNGSISWQATISGGADFLAFARESAGVGNGTLTILFEDNESGEARSGAITVQAGPIEGSPAVVNIEQAAASAWEERPISSADQDGDQRIALDELLRLIQFYNVGSYHCDTIPGESEDGYIAGGGADETCMPHTSDYMGGASWSIDLNELLRVIQFHNIGGYAYCPDNATEDGFCPGLLR
jgi:hypothetical protein